jgi:hypothetical protein
MGNARRTIVFALTMMFPILTFMERGDLEKMSNGSYTLYRILTGLAVMALGAHLIDLRRHMYSEEERAAML